MEKYLDQCIQSLIQQSYHNIEIILINDGSSDDSGAICRKYEEFDPRVIYVEQRNRGTAAARNAGLERAVGEWISFVDADDWLPENAVAALAACANGYDIAIGDYYCVSDGKARWEHFFRQDVSDEDKVSSLWLIGNALGCPAYGIGGGCNIGVPWARLFRKAFLVENGICSPVGLKRMQDTVLNIRAFMCAPRICYCPQPVYYYRVWGKSASRAYDHQPVLLPQRLSVESERKAARAQGAVRESSQRSSVKRIQQISAQNENAGLPMVAGA